MALFAYYVLLFRLAPAGNAILASDSTGYLAFSRWVMGAGAMPQQLGPYTAFGYGIPLALPYGLTDSATSVYRAAVVLNAMIGGAMVIPLRALAREVLRLPDHSAVAAGAVGAAYPGVALQVGEVWPEILLPFLCAWWAVILVRALRTPSTRSLALLGCFAVVLFAVHHRTVAVVGVTVIALLSVASRPWRTRIAVVVALATGLLCVLALDRVVQGTLYPKGTSYSSIGDGIVPGAYGRAMTVLAGELWYSVAATGGTAFIAVLTLLGRRLETRRAARLILLAAAGTAVVAAVQVAGFWRQNGFASHFVLYGRYLEPFAPLLVALGTASVLHRFPRRAALASPLVLAALTIVQVVTRGATLEAGAQKANILGVLGYTSLFQTPAPIDPHVRFLSIALVASGVSAMVAGAVALGLRRVAVALTAVVFLASGIGGAIRSLRPFYTYWEQLDVDIIRAIERDSGSPRVGWVEAGQDPSSFNRLQMLAPDRKFLLLGRRAVPPSDVRLVIAPSDWPLAEVTGARPIAESSRRSGIVIFSLPRARRE